MLNILQGHFGLPKHLIKIITVAVVAGEASFGADGSEPVEVMMSCYYCGIWGLIVNAIRKYRVIDWLAQQNDTDVYQFS